MAAFTEFLKFTTFSNNVVNTIRAQLTFPQQSITRCLATDQDALLSVIT